MTSTTGADHRDEVRMEIRGLIVDPSSNRPIVLLHDAESQLILPIWIGIFEANAIAQRIENADLPRPMTHDLMQSILQHVRIAVKKIVICDLREDTFFALIHVDRDGEEIEVDARPSDAIALALRAEAPIFVLRPVLEKAKAVEIAHTTDEEKLKKWLEEVSPEDLGKYTM